VRKIELRPALASSLPRLSGFLLCVAGLLAASVAGASERRFGFTYDTSVLAPGEAELEPWTTVRAGRRHFYSAFDQRLEFELGLAPNLQTSLYWNFGASSETVRDPGTQELTRREEFHLSSLASEWKYKLSDPLADAIGSALYVEASYGPHEIELEGKLILDKQSGNWFFAANLSGEQEWELEVGETESEQHYGVNLAAGYFVAPTLLAGLEAVSVTTVEDGEVESSAIYAGPSLAYAADRYWVVASAAPQLFAPKAESGQHLDLRAGERVWARLLLGFHI
jgi:hypothetical protein